MIKVTMFGREKEFYFANSAIKHLDELREAIKKPQVVGYPGGYEVISLVGYNDYDYDNCVSSDTVIKYALEKLGYEGPYNGSAIMKYSIEDDAETERINRRYRAIYSHSITFGEELQAVILAEADRAQEEIIAQDNEEREREAAEKARAEAEKAALLDGVKWETTERTITDEGGKTTLYIHTITISGEKFIIKERNVFDVGRCINADGGGLYAKSNGEWVIERFTDGEGWIPEKISEANQRAAEIVHKYGGFANSLIRM